MNKIGLITEDDRFSIVCFAKASRMTGISRTTLLKWKRIGYKKRTHNGNKYYFNVDEIEKCS